MPKDKFKELEKRLQEAQRKSPKPTKKHQSKIENSIAYRVIIDLAAGILVGGFLGYVIDHTLNTKPFGMVILLLLGAIGGFYTVFKDISKL